MTVVKDLFLLKYPKYMVKNCRREPWHKGDQMIDKQMIPTLEGAVRKYWDFPAFTDYPGSAMSYSEVGKRMLWLHRLYESAGIKKGSKIALVGKNSSHWALVWIGTVAYGATIVPILPNFTPEETQHIVNHSDAEILFMNKSSYQNLDRDGMRKLKRVYALEDFELLCNGQDKDFKDIAPFQQHKDLHNLRRDDFKLKDVCDREDIATIIYTSGTTGFSKGVLIPHRSLVGNLVYAHENLLFSEGAKVFAFLPLAHAYASAFDLLYPFTRGNHMNFLDRIPVPKVLLAAMKDLNPEVVLTVPLLIEKIYRKQLQPLVSKPVMKIALKLPIVNKLIIKKIHDTVMSAFGGNIRELITGGAPMNAEVELFMKKIRFPFTIGYGMTECGPLIAYANWQNHRFESSGKRVTYLEVKIDSKSPAKIPGEILVRGEQLFSGYYKYEEATQESIKDGWFHTGDIGTMDKDGFIYIRGRSKNVILGPSGENIYPELIEQRLNNMPYVGESLVLERDSQVHAIVYPDYEALDAERIPQSKIKEIMEQNRIDLNAKSASFNRIIKLHITPEPFQKTPTQKIKRFMYK